MDTLTLARFVCELSLLEMHFVPVRASLLASACLLIALVTKDLGGWVSVSEPLALLDTHLYTPQCQTLHNAPQTMFIKSPLLRFTFGSSLWSNPHLFGNDSGVSTLSYCSSTLFCPYFICVTPVWSAPSARSPSKDAADSRSAGIKCQPKLWWSITCIYNVTWHFPLYAKPSRWVEFIISVLRSAKSKMLRANRTSCSTYTARSCQLLETAIHFIPLI